MNQTLDILVRVRGDAQAGINSIRAFMNSLGGLGSVANGAIGALGSIGSVMSTGITAPARTAASVLMQVFVGAQQSASSLLGTLSQVGDGIQNLQSLGQMAMGVASSFVSSNIQMESFLTRYEALLKTADAAKARVAELQALNVKSPFELPDLIAADLALQSSGKRTKEMVMDVANAAAALGGTKFEIMEISQAVSRLASGDFGDAFQRLRELNVASKAELEGKGIKFDSSGAYKGSIEEALTAVQELMREKFGNAAELAAGTWTGIVSNISDRFGMLRLIMQQPVFETLKIELQKILDAMNDPRWEALAGFIGVGLQVALQGTIAVLSALGGILSGGVQSGFDSLNQSVGGFISFIGAVIAVVTPLGQAIQAVFIGDFSAAAGYLSGFVDNIAALFISGFANLGSDLYTWGSNVITSFADGILSGAGSAVAAAISYVTSLIASFLQGFSPPKEGALSTIDTWFPNVLDAYLGSWGKADWGVLDDLTDRVASTFEGLVESGKLSADEALRLVVGDENGQGLNQLIAGAINDIKTTGGVSLDKWNQIKASLEGTNGELLAAIEAQLLNVQLNNAIDQLQGELAALESSDSKDALKESIDAAKEAVKGARDKGSQKAAKEQLAILNAEAKRRKSAAKELRYQIDTIKDMARANEEYLGGLDAAIKLRKKEADFIDTIIGKIEDANKSAGGGGGGGGADQMDKNAEAAWRYSYAIADNQTKLGMLREKLAGVEEGSAEYYGILGQIHSLEEEMAADAQKSVEEQAKLAAARAEAARNYSYAIADNQSKLGMLQERLAGVEEGSVEYYSILGQIHDLEGSIASDNEQIAKQAEQDAARALTDAQRRADAEFQYQMKISDTAGKLALLRGKLGEVEEGSAEYYGILGQIHDLEAQAAKEAENRGNKAAGAGRAGAAGAGDLAKANVGVAASLGDIGKASDIVADSVQKGKDKWKKVGEEIEKGNTRWTKFKSDVDNGMNRFANSKNPFVMFFARARDGIRDFMSDLQPVFSLYERFSRGPDFSKPVVGPDAAKVGQNAGEDGLGGDTAINLDRSFTNIDPGELEKLKATFKERLKQALTSADFGSIFDELGLRIRTGLQKMNLKDIVTSGLGIASLVTIGPLILGALAGIPVILAGMLGPFGFLLTPLKLLTGPLTLVAGLLSSFGAALATVFGVVVTAGGAFLGAAGAVIGFTSGAGAALVGFFTSMGGIAAAVIGPVVAGFARLGGVFRLVAGPLMSLGGLFVRLTAPIMALLSPITSMLAPIGGLALRFASLFSPLAGLLGPLTGVFGALGGLLSPILLLLGPLALLAAAVLGLQALGIDLVPSITKFGAIIGTAILTGLDKAIGFLSRFIPRLIQILSNAIPRIVAIMVGWTEALGAFVLAAIPKISALLQVLLLNFLNLVSTMVPLLGAGFGKWAATVGSFLINALPLVLTGLQNIMFLIGDWVVTEAPKLLMLFAQWGVNAIQWVIDAAPAVLTALTNFIDSIIAWIIAKAPEFANNLVVWGTKFYEWVAPQIPGMLTALGDLAMQLLGWLGEKAVQIGGVLLEWGLQFIGWIAPQIPGMLAALGELALGLLGWLAEKAVELGAKLLEWGLQFINWIGPQIPGMLVALGGLMLGILGWIGEQALALGGKLLEWAGAFLGWIGTDVLPGLPSKLIEITFAILGWIATTALDIVGKIATWTIAFFGWVAETLIGLPGKLKEIFLAIVAWIVGSGPGIATNVKGWVSSFFAWVGEVLIGVPTKVQEIRDTLGTEIGKFGAIVGAKMLEVGKAIIAGLVEGVKGIGGALYDATVGPMVDGISSLATKLGINSPSTYVRDNIGVPIMQGVTAGIEQEAPGMQSTWSNSFDPLTGIVDGVRDPLNTSIAGTVSGMAAGIAPIFGQMNTDTQAQFATMNTQSQATVAAMAAALGLTSAGMQTALTGSNTTMAATILQTITGMKDSVTGQFSGLKDNADGIIGTLKTTALGQFSGLRDGIDTTAATLRESGLGVGRNIIEGMVSGIQTKAAQLAQTAANAAGAAVTAAKQRLGIESPSGVMRDEVGAPTIEGFILGITDKQGSLESTMQGAITPLVGIVQDTAAPMQAGIVDAVTGVNDAAIPLFSELEDKVSRHMFELRTKGTEEIEYFRSNMATTSGIARDQVVATTQNMGMETVAAIHDMETHSTETMGTLAANATAASEQMAGGVAAGAEQAKTGVIGASGAMSEGALAEYTALAARAQDVIQKLGITIASMGDQFREAGMGIGISLSAGIIEGIESMLAEVERKVREMGLSLVEALKDVLGISSPSKVAMMQVGVPFTQGVAVGVVREFGTLAATVAPLRDTLLNPLSTLGKDASALLNGVNNQMRQSPLEFALASRNEQLGGSGTGLVSMPNIERTVNLNISTDMPAAEVEAKLRVLLEQDRAAMLRDMKSIMGI